MEQVPENGHPHDFDDFYLVDPEDDRVTRWQKSPQYLEYLDIIQGDPSNFYRAAELYEQYEIQGFLANPNEVPFARFYLAKFYVLTESPCTDLKTLYKHFEDYCGTIGYAAFSRALLSKCMREKLGFQYDGKKFYLRLK